MAFVTTFVLCFFVFERLDFTSSCYDGHFSDKDGECKKCPEHCPDCDSNERCLSCADGYWGTICELRCSRCQPGTSCEKTNGFCFDRCKDGYTGILCDAVCNEKCLSCDRMNAGQCEKCADRFYGGTCELCVNGYWGPMCEEECSKECRDNSCDRQMGTCTGGYKNNSSRTINTNIGVDMSLNNDEKIDEKPENDGKDEGQQAKDDKSGKENEANREVRKLGTTIVIVIAIVVAVLIVGVAMIAVYLKFYRKRLTNRKRKGSPQQDEPEAQTEEALLPGTEMTTSDDSGVCSLESPPPSLKQETEVCASPITVDPPGHLNIRFVNDFNGTKTYTICKDPINNYSEALEFWALVWQENCSVIVKLSRNVEETQDNIYWPEKNETNMYGAISVTLTKVYSDTYRQRTFEMKTTTSEPRKVIHMQFLEWPRDRLPRNETILLEFRQKVEGLRDRKKPILVHCSDGHSRSGVYVAVDMLLNELEKQDQSDAEHYNDKLQSLGLLATKEHCDFLRRTEKGWRQFKAEQQSKDKLKVDIKPNHSDSRSTAV